jgi:hypothetical protein
MLRQQQVARGRHRQELGDALNDAQDDDRQPLFHAGVRREKTALGKRELTERAGVCLNTCLSG